MDLPTDQSGVSASTARREFTSPTTATTRENSAALKHAAELIGMGIECFRVQFPRGQDANEFALKQQPAAHWLGMYLQRAAWLGKGQRPTVAVIEPQTVKKNQNPQPKKKSRSQRHRQRKKKSLSPSER